MKHKISLRPIHSDDPRIIHESFQQQSWNKPASQYRQYLLEQQGGTRDVIIAEMNHEFVGYLTIRWQSDYPSFREKGIPEIVDFNVLQRYQRRGIGTALMDEAEERIGQVSDFAGIGVGLTRDYGAAQILYFKRNYIPDGRGIVQGSRSIGQGDLISVDHGVVLYLTKKLL